MATTRDANAMKKAGKLIKEQAKLATDGVIAAELKGKLPSQHRREGQPSSRWFARYGKQSTFALTSHLRTSLQFSTGFSHELGL